MYCRGPSSQQNSLTSKISNSSLSNTSVTNPANSNMKVIHENGAHGEQEHEEEESSLQNVQPNANSTPRRSPGSGVVSARGGAVRPQDSEVVRPQDSEVVRPQENGVVSARGGAREAVTYKLDMNDSTDEVLAPETADVTIHELP